MKVRNTFLIFLVSGFWHGANWTFIIWGCLNALYIMPSIIFNTNRNNLEIVAKGKQFPTFIEISQILFTFCLTTFAWIFFRADNVTATLKYIRKIFFKSLFTIPTVLSTMVFLLLSIFIAIEWKGREHNYAIENLVSDGTF